MISGYNNDPRSLYEIPQVQRWITGITHGLGASWTKFMGASTVPIPDWLYWLTPGSLYLCTLSMIPSMHNRLANGKLLIEFDTDKISELCAKSIVAAEDVLKQAGLSDETVEDITEQSAMNMINMLCGEKLGDYVVLYPTDGQIRTYRKRIN